MIVLLRDGPATVRSPPDGSNPWRTPSEIVAWHTFMT